MILAGVDIGDRNRAGGGERHGCVARRIFRDVGDGRGADHGGVVGAVDGEADELGGAVGGGDREIVDIGGEGAVEGKGGEEVGGAVGEGVCVGAVGGEQEAAEIADCAGDGG